jgi:hypothetical protein
MRRFRAPWTVEAIGAGFKVIDANGQDIAAQATRLCAIWKGRYSLGTALGMLTVPRHHLDHGMPCQTKDISVIKALILAAMIGEHWVCATPVDSKINLADIFLFDFEVEEKIVQKSGTAGATLRQTSLGHAIALAAEGEVEAFDQRRAVERLIEIANRAGLQRSSACSFFRVGGNENNWRRATFLAQAALQLQPAQARHVHIDDQASRLVQIR